MRIRKIVLILFIVVLILPFIYIKFGESAMNLDPELSDKEVEQLYRESWDDQDIVESRLTYAKSMAVVHVIEMNNASLFSSTWFDLEERVATLNTETKSIYFTDQNIVPRQDDNIIVIEDIQDLETLLKQNIYRSRESVSYKIRELSQEDPETATHLVLNENRLFVGESMQIRYVNEEGDIEVELAGVTKVIPVGESELFERYNEEGSFIGSKILVSNYGMWEAINMTYVVGN